MKEQIIKAVSKLWKSTKKHSPEILTCVGITGLVSGTIMAIAATPKALLLVEQMKEEKNEDKLSALETVKATWKVYLPIAITEVVSAGCIVCAHSVTTRRSAALTTAYALSESALKEYQKKTKEIVGDKKEESIRDAIAKDRIEADPVTKTVVIDTGKGTTLCYDALFGRYFYSDIDAIKRAENEVNRYMMNEMYIPLNFLYQELNMPEVGGGDILGWGMMDGFINILFSTQISDDGRPCLVISYQNPPRYDYQNRY